MARIRSIVVGTLGAAALAAAVAAIRNMRAVPLPGAVPPPPPSRPPERPTLDEAPRPASEPARPQISEPAAQGTKPEPEERVQAGSASSSDGEPRTAELELMSRDRLYAEARRRNLPGRSRMTKEELVRALSSL